MDKHQIIDRISDAMNAIADNEPGSALLVLYSLQRNLRYDFEPPKLGEAYDPLVREAMASVALDGDTYSLEGIAAEKLRLLARSPFLAGPPRTNDEMKAERIRERDRARKQRDRDLTKAVGDLPKMKPINGKRIISSEVSCPTCHAKAGDPCLRLTSRGKYGVPIVPHVEAAHYHHPRTAKAKAARG